MMRYFDDGRVGLSIEPVMGILRLLSAPATEGKPGFLASGSLIRITDKVCKLAGFSGSMSIRHQALVALSLREMGYSVLYVERIDGGTIAFGELITEGDFEGCIRLELDRAGTRAQKRYGLLS